MIPEVSPNGHTAVPLSTLITELYGDHQSAATSQHQAATPAAVDLDAVNRPEREAFRAAVDQVAARAKATLPESSGRVEKAVAMVLAGDVELLPDGHARVASQCQGTTQYHITNGICTCRDFPRAPSGWCKHRIAAGIQRRALQAVSTSTAVSTLPAAAATHPLQEAPASANCHVTIAGRQVQVTLRDTDETRLLTRLTALLARYPVPEASPGPTTPPNDSTATGEGFCAIHQVEMRLNTKEGRSWYSHSTGDGWCKGKAKGQGR